MKRVVEAFCDSEQWIDLLHTFLVAHITTRLHEKPVERL